MGGFLDRLTGVKSLAAVYLITFLWGLAAIFMSHFDPGGLRIHRRIVRSWARTVLSVIGIRPEIDGLGNLDAEKGPFVVVVNHQSQLDIPVLVKSIPLQLRFIGKVELSRVPVFGKAVSRAGHIFIDRTDHEQSMSSLKRAAERIRDLGVSLVFAAEGTRSADSTLGPFKKGAFVMAIEAGLPILPVVIQGTGKCLPKGSLMARKGPVNVRVLPPVQTRNLGYDDRDRLKDQVRADMAKELARLEV